MEWMDKTYATCGEGILELFNTVVSFAQAFSEVKVCRCDHCVESRGGELETQRLEQEREERLRFLSFQGLLDKIDLIFDDGEDEEDNVCPYNNGSSTGVTEEGEPFVYYCTGGDLIFQVTELKSGEYLFEVFPPKQYFRGGSTLYTALASVGYTYHTDNERNYNIGETGLTEYVSSCECDICQEQFSVDEDDYQSHRYDYCPYCGRRVILWHSYED